MCKNSPVLNLPNKGDDLIVETDASNKHWSAVLKIKEGENLLKYCNGSFNKEKMQLFHDEKRNHCSHKGN